MNIAVACGGTGGHIFPGVAVAEVLKKRGHAVTLWLAGRDVESGSTAGWHGSVISVKAAGFPSGFAFRAVAVAWRLFVAFLQCRGRMKGSRPDVLLAMGSYSSVGPVLAARLAGVPVVLHEANAVPGRALAALAPLADCVAVHFEAAAGRMRARRVVVTGMPLRAELEAAADGVMLAGANGAPAPFRLLVMGGSQGAVRLNAAVVGALRLLAARGAAPAVIHLAGPRNAAATRAAYAEAGVAAEVMDFCREMASVYRRIDAAISRSGAASCAELALFGRPAILVPYPEAARDHQRANAMAIEAAGGAWLLDQAAATPAALASGIERLRADSDAYRQMAGALRRLSVPHAAARLADLVEKTARRPAAPQASAASSQACAMRS